MNEYQERALESVVETILLFGRYPQPRTGKLVRSEFDLIDFVCEHAEIVDPVELAEFFVFALTDQDAYGQFYDYRLKWEKKIEAALTEHLKDSDMVNDLAEKYREEDEEERCTCGSTSVNATTINPPERKKNAWCEIHGHRDPDIERERDIDNKYDVMDPL